MILLLYLYFFFFKKFEKSFPIIIALIYVINYLGITYPVLKVKESAYLILLLFLVKSIFLLKRIRLDFLIKISIILIFIYLVYIGSFFGFNKPSLKEFLRKTNPLVFQFYIFIALVYFKSYGTKVFFKYTYFAMLLYLIVWSLYIFIIPYQGVSIIGLEAYHAATIGFSAAYVIAYNLLIKRNKNILIVIIVSLLPFLGMGRGGIFAISIAFLGYFISKRHIKSSVFTIIIFALIIFFSNYLITSFLPKNILYYHQGATNLSALFKESENVDKTLLPRIIRWDFLYHTFLEYPVFGAGFAYSTASSGLPLESFYDIWQGHNFFLSMLAAGGIIIALPIVILTFWGIERSFLLFIKNRLIKYEVFGAILFYNIININFTNTYFIIYWAAPMIWVLFSAGLYELGKEQNNITTAYEH